ncbi:hypothetical protein, unlikely [Trypanosoma brucei brucei TREU927]|uniref:Uncharacterized protein n=1 Tax=Trypanosoma brucei brucei (strain 927/4 GUTat10.1) TaxID=185431 RepID=Q4GZC3_TRYB2|nr:hypothetical protein, unlikely [Trypanosoma brucei brucei TREU927]CAJ16021.1 hypothetical protein, unlikely [Trypanosoma brucei brucei TREU927]
MTTAAPRRQQTLRHRSGGTHRAHVAYTLKIRSGRGGCSINPPLGEERPRNWTGSTLGRAPVTYGPDIASITCP